MSKKKKPPETPEPIKNPLQDAEDQLKKLIEDPHHLQPAGKFEKVFKFVH